MNRATDNLVDVRWVAQCAHRLRRQWPHADVASLEEAAIELWRIDWMREMSGEDAAELWLHPLCSGSPGLQVEKVGKGAGAGDP